MSVEVMPETLQGAEKIITADDMYRLGLEASTPGMADEPDLITAHKWFNLAALQGSEPAREYRQQLTIEMSPKQIAEAQRQAREWLASRRPAVEAHA